MRVDDGVLVGGPERASTGRSQVGDGPSGPKRSTARAPFADGVMKLGAVFERSSTGMCVLDAGAHIRDVNDAMCGLLGRSRDDLLGSDWTRLTHPDDSAREAVLFHETASGLTEGYSLEKRVVRPGGDLAWCRVTATRLTGGERSAPAVLLETVDTTATHALAERNRAVEERIKLAMTATQDAFVAMDAGGMIVEWNAAAETMFGWRAEEAIGRSLASTIVPEDQRAAHERGLARYLTTGEGPVLNKKVEVNALRRDGTEFIVELTIWPIAGDGAVEFNAFLRDVSERLRFQEELRRLAIAATTDQGTGLKNRRGFFALAQHELNVAQRLGQPLTLIFFDLDRLKQINDTLGHLEGDRAIADTAHVLSSTFRESDIVARLGGDEFCVLALGPPAGFEQTMRRFQDAVDEHNRSAKRPYTLSLSYGVAFFDPADGPVSLDDLMSQADTSMYQAKVRPRSA